MDIEKKLIRATELLNEEKLLEAEFIYEQILEENAQNEDVLSFLADLKRQQRRFTIAEQYINSAIEINPKSDFYLILAKIHHDNNCYCEAIEDCKKSIGLNFDNIQAWFWLGQVLAKNGQHDDAIIAYHRVIMLQEDFADAYRFIGNIYYTVKNDPEKAIEYYEEVIKITPDNVKAKGALGAAYLKIKNYKIGWKYFDFRPNKRIVTQIRMLIPGNKLKEKPIWNGEIEKGKTLYVYYEGGFGDTIMFSRFLPLLKERGVRVLFRPQVELISLLKENNLGVEIIEAEVSEDVIEFDYHTPMMSLPYYLGIDSEADIPCKTQYLHANSEKSALYKDKYFNNDKFKIGIKWQGNTIYDESRVVDFDSLIKLFDLKNIQFYSLQKGSGTEKLEYAKKYGIVDLGSDFNDFSDTAAAVDNLNLVICNDTSVAHLAASMGKKCWVLLPFIQDWRWSTDLSYCLWYDNIKFFQQKEKGNWTEVIDRVHVDLQKILSL